MFLPHMKHAERGVRQTITTFGGYDHAAVIPDNCFYDMKNLTSDMYPVLAVRGERQQVTGGGYAPEDVFFCADVMVDLLPPRMVLNGALRGFDLGLISGVSHSIVMMGAYLVIFPEGVYINTANTEERGSLEKTKRLREWSAAEYFATFLQVRNCDEQGNALEISGSFSGPAESFAPDISMSELEGTYWYSEDEKRIYQYRSKVNEPTDITSFDFNNLGKSYIRINLFLMYPIGSVTDTVWMPEIRSNDFISMADFPEKVSFLNGKHVVKKADNAKGMLIIEGYTGQEKAMTVDLTQYDDTAGGYIPAVDPMPSISHVIPPLDYVISCGNRLWGCRYGEGHDGDFVNEIYCTAEEDIHRWLYLADASASDNAWAASIGHAGPFTGAVSYGGRPYFFKQDRIYAVYGSDASTFGYTELVERGVQVGCDRSLCVLDGVLYYKAQDGIVAFDGSSTRLISDALGAVRYKNAVGGGVDGKYYVSLTDVATEKPSLFVYDARRGLWHREDGFAPMRMAADDLGNLWGLLDGKLTLLRYGGGNLRGMKEGLVPWMAETGIWGLDDPDRKYISRLSLRLSLDVGAYIKVSIQYDSVGSFEQVLFYEGVNLQTVTLPIIPRRCDHMRLRLEGEGNVRIYALTRTVESVGE